jgi:adenine/guanine/hypoxanthine permease
LRSIESYFQFEKLGTTIHREIVAGFTTFVTMAYIIVVNPKILEAAGIPFGPSMVATILSAFFGTMVMGLYAKRPFAVAPYMGENAFVAYTVVKVMGYSWQTALGAIFISGVLFTILTVLKVRGWLAEAIPESLKIGFAVGIGLFLTFIGLNESGIIRLGVDGAPVHVGDFHQIPVLLAILGFLLMSFLMIKRVKGAMLIGIITITIAAFIFKLTPLPITWISMPPSLSPIFLQLDITGAITWGFVGIIMTVFVMDLVDTLGTLIGLAYKANLLDENGNLPEIEKPMLCDALATTVGALLGTTTTGAYVESATGIEAGGRSGFTAVVTALLFLLALFAAPSLTVIPAIAYGPALIIVGLLMMSPIAKLKFDDLAEAVPVYCTIVLMSFTFNIGIGMTAGFLLYPLFKLITGKIQTVKPGLWILAGLSLLFFVFYPY